MSPVLMTASIERLMFELLPADLIAFSSPF
jgi:hypothetical protein